MTAEATEHHGSDTVGAASPLLDDALCVLDVEWLAQHHIGIRPQQQAHGVPATGAHKQ